MNAKKVAIGAGFAAAGMFVARSLGPKFHGHCQSMCAAGKCGGAHKCQDDPIDLQRNADRVR